MKNFFLKKHNFISRGYAVLELIFYIVLFSILSLVSINAVITMSRSFKETSIQADLVQSGSVLEKIAREIRQAQSINAISANSLVLNTKDTSGNNKTIGFSISSGNIQVSENGSVVGNLNSPNVLVSSLFFTQITTAKGVAVKVVLSLSSRNDTSGVIYDFYNTVVLRGSYQ